MNTCTFASLQNSVALGPIMCSVGALNVIDNVLDLNQLEGIVPVTRGGYGTHGWPLYCVQVLIYCSWKILLLPLLALMNWTMMSKDKLS
jgi:hypothetical protein